MADCIRKVLSSKVKVKNSAKYTSYVGVEMLRYGIISAICA